MISESVGWILDQRFSTKLSVSICLADDFTGKREIKGSVKVSIPEKKLNAIRNPSGYYNFLDIPDDTYTFEIDPQLYLNEKIENFVLPRNTSYNLSASG
ncbi:hypothetical protein KAU34_07395, partial [candidate division WOR-3 bacterium]|nr:hypothetical protein [candidate division WOR-3 bacterium]